MTRLEALEVQNVFIEDRTQDLIRVKDA